MTLSRIHITAALFLTAASVDPAALPSGGLTRDVHARRVDAEGKRLENQNQELWVTSLGY
ncbi:MAG: hypothetical protein ACREOG_16550 [Gemmatimonadaceae bacterium]